MNTTRREWMVRLSAIGIGSVAFQRALAQQVGQSSGITIEMIRDALWIADIELNENEQASLLQQIQSQTQADRALCAVEYDADLCPATAFVPYFFAERVNAATQTEQLLHSPDSVRQVDASWSPYLSLNDPPSLDWSNEESVAAASIRLQAWGIRHGKISSVELTRLYLKRLKQWDAKLRCVVSLTEDLALQQAAQADKEIQQGIDRGLLQGIPWGAKDILAVPPYPTTWGTGAYRDKVRPNLATVVERLNAAGAVLLGKLSVGTLAMGDQWHEATTKNPWNSNQGSSGSSAGSASATAAGLCTFAIGTETLGSIVSPAQRCRVMGLRPSFGRVSRYGCMTLAWTMDKVGVLARHALDCGIVLHAIQGVDGKDPTVVDRPINAPARDTLKSLRVGYRANPISASEKILLDRMAQDGMQLVPIEYPENPLIDAMLIGLDAESACMHETLFRSIREDKEIGLWAPTFRKAQFLRGIPYIASLRARAKLIEETERVLQSVDVVLGTNDLVRTNLTGHPSMVVCFGSEPVRRANRADAKDAKENAEAKPSESFYPRTVKLTARFFGDGTLIAVADYIERTLPASPALPIWEE